MATYVLARDAALRLAGVRPALTGEHQLLAPALLRSQVLAELYQAVRRGELTKPDAERRLDYLRGLRMRLLGDRVLQRVAWQVAERLGWPDTYDAEYVALTQLHGSALVTDDQRLADAASPPVTVVGSDVLS